MKPKQLTLVVILAVVLGGLGYWMNRRATPPSTGATLGGRVLPDFPLNDVSAILISDGTNELTLARREGVWRVQERFDYPANFGNISDFLRKVWELKAVQTESIGESGLARLQLLEPGEGRSQTGTLVVFKGGMGEELAQLVLGRQQMRRSEAPTQFGDGSWPEGRWVRAVGGPMEAALVSEPFSNIELRPDRWIDKEFFRVEKFKRAEVAHPDPDDSWTIYREREGGELRLADLREGENFDPGAATAVGNLLSWPSFNDLADPRADPEITGLDQPVVARIETFDGFHYTVRVGGTTDTNDNYFVQVQVTGDFPRQREAAEDESPEDRERLDREFEGQLDQWREKLAKEERVNGWTYLVSRWTVENLLKRRSEFLRSPEETSSFDVDEREWLPSALDPVAVPRIEDLAGLPAMEDLPVLPQPQPGVAPPVPPLPPAPPDLELPDGSAVPEESTPRADPSLVEPDAEPAGG